MDKAKLVRAKWYLKSHLQRRIHRTQISIQTTNFEKIHLFKNAISNMIVCVTIDIWNNSECLYHFVKKTGFGT